MVTKYQWTGTWSNRFEENIAKTASKQTQIAALSNMMARQVGWGFENLMKAASQQIQIADLSDMMVLMQRWNDKGRWIDQRNQPKK
jgi:hypothetical protein